MIILNTTDYTKTTLGELLSSENETIRRNAVSILKQLQSKKEKCIFHAFKKNSNICINCKEKIILDNPCWCGSSELPEMHDKKDCKNPF